MALGPRPPFPPLYTIMKRKRDKERISNFYSHRNELLKFAETLDKNAEKSALSGDDASAASWLRLADSTRSEARFMGAQGDALSEVLQNPQGNV